jgi:hypothetical protein
MRPKSGYHGVNAKGKRWRAEISYGGKRHCLGGFETKQEAALAYDREARLCGEPKKLNWVTQEAYNEAAAEFPNLPERRAAKAPRTAAGSGSYGVTAKGNGWQAEISSYW